MAKPLIRLPFPKNIKRPGVGWTISRVCVLTGAWIVDKLVMHGLNKPRFHNTEVFHNAVSNRPTQQPLLTVANHASCFDDPGIFSVQSFRTAVGPRAKWATGAQDIIFTNSFVTWGLSRGQVVPIYRGSGVYQIGIGFLLDRLSEGGWVHIFPESRVNMNEGDIRFKWGVGRLLADSLLTPLLLPIWHCGMDRLLPSRPHQHWIPRLNNKVTVVFGEPIDFSTLVTELKLEGASGVVTRKRLTDRVQEIMFDLRDRCNELHAQYLLD